MPFRRKDPSRVRQYDSAVDDAVVADLLGALVTIRPSGEILWWPAGAERLFGYTPNEAVGRSYLELVVPESDRPAMAQLVRTVGPRVARVTAATRIRKDGRQFLVDVAMRSDHTAVGDVVLINDRHAVGGEPVADPGVWHAGFRTVFESIPEAILLVDHTGIIIEMNTQASRLFDYSREALLGATVETLVPDRDRRIHASHRAAYAQEPRQRPMGIGLELAGRRRDGTIFPVEINLSPLDSGAPTWS